MNTILTAISLLGGLAMFLYGMEIMGEGLKQGSGPALKDFLGKLTYNTVMGVITGTIVTAIIQSSTATIVLTVGLVGAGVLNLKQAVSIVMGANIGTTVTAQIIRLMDIETSGGSLLTFFKPDTLAPLALTVGIILTMFVKKKRSKNIGVICMGFGILFTGLILMTDSVKPLADSPAFVGMLSYFSDMPVLGILTGLVLTVIIQSSSAMVGILQALSSTGLMSFNLIYPMIMGINLGTCVTTALVCSVGTSKDSKRTGIVHIIFNTVGTILFMIAMTILKGAGFWPDLWDSIVNSGVIANFQTLFNLITAVVLLPFTGILVDISCRIVKDDPPKEDPYPQIAPLDSKLLISPSLALNTTSTCVAAMAKAARENIERGIMQLKDTFDSQRSDDINVCEDCLDRFADSADNYLVELSQLIKSNKEYRHINMLMQCVPAVERIGDYATNLNEMSETLYESDLKFSENAIKEIGILGDAVLEILNLTIEVLETESKEAAHRIEPLEEVIDDMVLVLKSRHTARLCQGVCSVNSGLVFLDALAHLERTADQCSNVAMYFLGRDNAEIMKNQHLYLHELHNSDISSYKSEHNMRREQFLLPLEQITL